MKEKITAYLAEHKDEMVEDIFRLVTWRQSVVSETEQLRRKAIAFARNHRTFPLDWSRNKLSREELNER